MDGVHRRRRTSHPAFSFRGSLAPRAPFPKRLAERSEACASAAPAEYPKLVWTYTPFVNPQWGLGALPRGSQPCPRGLSGGQRLRTLLEVRGRPGDRGQPGYAAQGLSGGGRVPRSRSQARGQTPAEQEGTARHFSVPLSSHALRARRWLAPPGRDRGADQGWALSAQGGQGLERSAVPGSRARSCPASQGSRSRWAQLRAHWSELETLGARYFKSQETKRALPLTNISHQADRGPQSPRLSLPSSPALPQGRRPPARLPSSGQGTEESSGGRGLYPDSARTRRTSFSFGLSSDQLESLISFSHLFPFCYFLLF